jgi:uncharacterized membrane protein
MTVLLGYASLLCVVAGLICGPLAAAVGRDVRAALKVALDLWMAAGLLRLALPPSASALLAAAAIIVVRQLVGFAFRTTAREP